MKYIRTKNEVREFAERFNLEHYRNCGFNDEDIVRKFIRNGNIFADTIEELCDEFIYITSKGQKIIEKYFSRNNGVEIINVYGAIWTDKGLIYVAKMNDKGELELI